MQFFKIITFLLFFILSNKSLNPSDRFRFNSFFIGCLDFFLGYCAFFSHAVGAAYIMMYVCMYACMSMGNSNISIIRFANFFLGFSTFFVVTLGLRKAAYPAPILRDIW